MVPSMNRVHILFDNIVYSIRYEIHFIWFLLLSRLWLCNKPHAIGLHNLIYFNWYQMLHLECCFAFFYMYVTRISQNVMWIHFFYDNRRIHTPHRRTQNIWPLRIVKLNRKTHFMLFFLQNKTELCITPSLNRPYQIIPLQFDCDSAIDH